MPVVPLLLLAAVIGYTYYSSHKGDLLPFGHHGHGGHPHGGLGPASGPMPGGMPMPIPVQQPGMPPLAYGPVPYGEVPIGPHHHHHHHHALPGAAPGVPEWLEPGMSPDYARAVWQAYYFEHDPRNLHAFGDRLHEMRLHRAGDALHRRAAAVEHRLHQQPYAV